MVVARDSSRLGQRRIAESGAQVLRLSGRLGSVSGGVIAAVFFAGTFLVSALVVGTGMQRARRLHPREIVATISRQGAEAHVARVPPGVKAWDPSTPVGPHNGIMGPGIASYVLDEGGQVHLTFQRGEGRPVLRQGPVPDNLPAWPLSVHGYTRIGRKTVGWLRGPRDQRPHP